MSHADGRPNHICTHRYVIGQMRGLGYYLHKNLTAALRTSSRANKVNHWWLRSTLMAFERLDPLVSDPRLDGAACRPSDAGRTSFPFARRGS